MAPIARILFFHDPPYHPCSALIVCITQNEGGKEASKPNQDWVSIYFCLVWRQVSQTKHANIALHTKINVAKAAKGALICLNCICISFI